MSSCFKCRLQRAAVVVVCLALLALALGGRQFNRWLTHHAQPQQEEALR